MVARLVGGPADGRTTDATTPTVLIPVVTRDWVTAYREWAARFLVAWQWTHLNGETWDGPEPPGIPSVAYKRRERDGETVYEAAP